MANWGFRLRNSDVTRHQPAGGLSGDCHLMSDLHPVPPHKDQSHRFPLAAFSFDKDLTLLWCRCELRDGGAMRSGCRNGPTQLRFLPWKRQIPHLMLIFRVTLPPFRGEYGNNSDVLHQDKTKPSRKRSPSITAWKWRHLRSGAETRGHRWNASWRPGCWAPLKQEFPGATSEPPSKRAWCHNWKFSNSAECQESPAAGKEWDLRRGSIPRQAHAPVRVCLDLLSSSESATVSPQRSLHDV